MTTERKGTAAASSPTTLAMSPLHDIGAAAWLAARGQAVPGSGDSVFQLANSNSSAEARLLLEQLRFAPAKSIRTSTIILAAFNAIAAFSTAFGILYDCYVTKKRNNRNFRNRYA